jgi:hypothetical protein
LTAALLYFLRLGKKPDRQFPSGRRVVARMDIIRWVLVPFEKSDKSNSSDEQQVKYVHLKFDSNDTSYAKSK